MFKALLFLILAFQANSFAQTPKPPGNPKAPTGGTMYVLLNAEPATLNPFSGATDAYTGQVLNYIHDSLMIRDIDTYSWVPAIAERYEVSKDGMTITFYMRKNAVFSDGKAITAEDVKFSFDAIFDPHYKAAVMQTYYENIASVEVVDPHTVKFNIKKKYFKNLESAAGITVLPKHIYGDKSKKMNKEALGSGPYMIEKYDQGRSIILTRNPKWWGASLPYYAGSYKADKIHLRIIREDNAALETLKRGELDYKGLSPEDYFLKTKGAPWGTKVLTKRYENSTPRSTPFVGWNNKHVIFKDREVRLAMTHLYNREEMAKKFFFGVAKPATGPWYQQNPSANPKTKAIAYDPKKAKEILAKAGWADTDKNGVLDKVIDGQKKEFRFTLLNPNKDYEKYFTVYKEELKKAGIDMSISNIEWNAFQKKMDEKDFEALFLVWGGTIEPDPKQIWHTASSQKGGSNFITYSNPKVDQLIDRAREEMDEKKRRPMMQEIYDLVAQDVPYTFLINTTASFYGYNSRMQMVQPTYKYAVGFDTWWISVNK
jgi:microcin C transport system substrate-binding protein